MKTRFFCAGTAVRKPVPGKTYVALFAGKYVEEITFLGESLDRGTPVRRFRSPGRSGNPYEWKAYKFGGRWSFGTSGEPLSLYPAGTPCSQW